MKSLNKFVLMATLCLLAGLSSACNRNAPAATPYGASLNATQGSFKQTKVVDASETPLHEDCTTTGGVIDSRLTVGMNFESIYKSINGRKVSKTLSTRARIIAVAKTSLQEAVMPLSSSGVTIHVGQEEPLTCSYDAQSKGSCVEPSFVSAADVATNGEYSQCQITGAGSDTTDQKNSEGTYTLGDGKTVNAFQILRSTKGTLVCGGRTLGTGDHIERIILSDAVPAEGASSACGGTQIFHSEGYRNNLQRVMMGYSLERTVIP